MKLHTSDLCGQSAYRRLEMKLHTSDLVWATSLLTPNHTWKWNYTQVICVGNRLTDAWKWNYTQVILCGQPAY